MAGAEEAAAAAVAVVEEKAPVVGKEKEEVKLVATGQAEVLQTDHQVAPEIPSTSQWVIKYKRKRTIAALPKAIRCDSCAFLIVLTDIGDTTMQLASKSKLHALLFSFLTVRECLLRAAAPQ
jgi:hypothetical protein